MAEKNFFEAKNSLNIKGKLIDLSCAKVMGIINVTPDSFYDKSRTGNIDVALNKAAQFLNEGASFIDIGAYSSRPGAKNISANEEQDRLVPIVSSIASHFPEAIISIDTFRAQVAETCINHGAHMINDISAGDLDEQMFDTVARLKVPYIMMHMQGTPQNMQQNPVYNHVVLNVIDYFAKKLAQLKMLNVHDVILDPGFGFGKTNEHNYALLNQLEDFKIFKLPVLVGFSRKGMIYKTIKKTAAEALNGTTVLNTVALQKGAGILRVHDVKEAVECVQLVSQLTH